MEVTQSFMDEMRGLMKVLLARSETQGAQIEGLAKQMAEFREELNSFREELNSFRVELNGFRADLTELRDEVTEMRNVMATKDDIKIIHEEIADLKTDHTYIREKIRQNSIDIYHLKLQMGRLHNEGQGPLQK